MAGDGRGRKSRVVWSLWLPHGNWRIFEGVIVPSVCGCFQPRMQTSCRALLLGLILQSAGSLSFPCRLNRYSARQMKHHLATSNSPPGVLVLLVPSIGWMKLVASTRSGKSYPLNLVRHDQSGRRRFTTHELIILEVSGVSALWNACWADSGKSFLLVVTSTQ